LSIFANIGLGQEKEYFIEQLSMLLSAGMPVVTALSSIKKEIKSGRLKKIIENMSVSIESGASISAAMGPAGIFSKSTISLIRIGEQSGRLAKNLKVVAVQQQKEREFRSKTASAMMYPLFVFSLTLIVGLGIAWFILPRLATVFAQLKIDLPLITQWLINLGTFLGRYGVIVIPTLLFAGLLILFFLFIYSKTNFLGQEILFCIGPISRLLIELELSRFGALVGNLLAVGLPVLDSLESLSESSTLYRYKKFYTFLSEKVKEGNSFAKCFALYKNTNRLIPVPIQQLIVTSEQSGNLPATFKEIGEIYETKTETTAKNITILLEPILLVIVWLGVVAVAVAVILPLYSLIGNLNSATTSTPLPVVKRIESRIATQSGTPSATSSATLKLKVKETGVGFLNVRTEPSLTSIIIKKVKPNDVFKYTNSEKGWYKIEYDVNSYGWVFGNYIDEIK
jgi:type II secretory pathway component PulF